MRRFRSRGFPAASFSPVAPRAAHRMCARGGLVELLGDLDDAPLRDLPLASHRHRDDLALHADEEILEADRLIAVGGQAGARAGGRARDAAREGNARHLAAAAAVQDDEGLERIIEVARGDGEGGDRLVADGAGALEVSDARLVEAQRAERQRLRANRCFARDSGSGVAHPIDARVRATGPRGSAGEACCFADTITRAKFPGPPDDARCATLRRCAPRPRDPWLHGLVRARRTAPHDVRRPQLHVGPAPGSR